jgi:hypothetical protein
MDARTAPALLRDLPWDALLLVCDAVDNAGEDKQEAIRTARQSLGVDRTTRDAVRYARGLNVRRLRVDPDWHVGGDQFRAFPNLTHLEWPRSEDPGAPGHAWSQGHVRLTYSHDGWGALLHHLVAGRSLPDVFNKVRSLAFTGRGGLGLRIGSSAPESLRIGSSAPESLRIGSSAPESLPPVVFTAGACPRLHVPLAEAFPDLVRLRIDLRVTRKDLAYLQGCCRGLRRLELGGKLPDDAVLPSALTHLRVRERDVQFIISCGSRTTTTT